MTEWQSEFFAILTSEAQYEAMANEMLEIARMAVCEGA